ncbi:MAG: hypothetical protein WBF71_08345 [Microthrixaceae bacterium]
MSRHPDADDTGETAPESEGDAPEDDEIRRAARVAQGEALPDPGGDIGAGAD